MSRSATAEEAGTVPARFVVTPYPLPQEGLDWIQQRLRGLTEEKEAALCEAAELRHALGQAQRHGAGLVRQVEASLKREKDFRLQILDAHGQLLQRDEELGGSLRGLIAERDRLRAEVNTLTLERDALSTERDTLTREFQSVQAHRDTLAVERDNLAAERNAALAQRDSCEARLARFRNSLLGRLYRCARGVLPLR